MAERSTAICAECDKVLYQGRMSLTDPNISHGSCKACGIKLLWLDGFNEPELTRFNNNLGVAHA